MKKSVTFYSLSDVKIPTIPDFTELEIDLTVTSQSQYQLT